MKAGAVPQSRDSAMRLRRGGQRAANLSWNRKNMEKARHWGEQRYIRASSRSDPLDYWKVFYGFHLLFIYSQMERTGLTIELWGQYPGPGSDRPKKNPLCHLCQINPVQSCKSAEDLVFMLLSPGCEPGPVMLVVPPDTLTWVTAELNQGAKHRLSGGSPFLYIPLNCFGFISSGFSGHLWETGNARKESRLSLCHGWRRARCCSGRYVTATKQQAGTTVPSC